MATAASFSRINGFLDRIGPIDTPFSIKMPDGNERSVGDGEPLFHVALRTDRAVKALGSLDEANFAEAYLQGDIDIDGDMISPFALRASMDDRHPVVAAWRFVQPLLFGQVFTNKAAITSHYDLDPKLFLSFLDPVLPAYSQGIYENDGETLETALRRKFDYAVEMCELGQSTRVLEIGPGWGAFASHALPLGVSFVGLTISEMSRKFIDDKLIEYKDQFEILMQDFLDYEPKEKFDSIVIMGVIEHLPNYERVLKKFYSLLKPGGLVFLDGSAARKKYELSTFMVRHIYPGNHSFLVLDDFLNKMNKTPFEVLEIQNDRHSYYLTFKQWAENLEASKDAIISEFGDFEYRKFRLYLWGATYEFLSRNLDCYRMVLYKPKDAD
ncbi:MAG: class I SAM-dependent methyltransferase [Hyphomicrobiales bacterium]|nr:class I SAM-dependent methyltransferase [Hyphomicrobiales bacterium]MCP4998044.1 class I SAM-dependent methyltransferase [Hyphomicrobiales bacterium]